MVQFRLSGYFGSDHQTTTIVHLVNDLCKKLKGKEQQYKGSWMKRGGVGAFMMLARKWDRIEVDATAHEYDIMEAINATAHKPDGLLDDIDDLIGYLLLVRAYHHDLAAVNDYKGCDHPDDDDGIDGPYDEDEPPMGHKNV